MGRNWRHFASSYNCKESRKTRRAESQRSEGMGTISRIFQGDAVIPYPQFRHHTTGNWLDYIFDAESFHTEKLCSRLFVFKLQISSKKPINLHFWAPLGDLEAMHVLQLRLVGKPIVNFLLAVIEHFLLAVMVVVIWACISQNGTAVILSLYSNRQMALRQVLPSQWLASGRAVAYWAKRLIRYLMYATHWLKLNDDVLSNNV